MAPAEVAPPGRPLSVDAMVADVAHLVDHVGPRPAGSPAAAEAADWLRDQITAAGLVPIAVPTGHIERPAIVALGGVIQPAGAWDLPDLNLIVRIPGRTDGPALLFLAHYDTVPTSPGAVDNAAAVAILLELGRALVATPPARPIVLAFTAAEELGLVGAVRVRESLAGQIGFAVALDLVGSRGTLTLNGLSSLIGGDALRFLAAAAVGVGVEVSAPLPHRVVSRHFPQLERSDHGVFTEIGVPAIHLYDRGEDRIFLAYHGPADRMDQLDHAALLDTARFVYALSQEPGELPRAGGRGDLLFTLGPPRVVPIAWLYGAELALALGALGFAVVAIGRRGARVPERGPGRVPLALPLALAAWLAALAAELATAAVRGHPVPWIHAPALALATTPLAALALTIALVAAVGPRASPAGPLRYALPAVAIWLAAGVALLAWRAPELAWIPLGAGFLLALATCLPRRAAPLAWLAALIPLVPLLVPGFVREACFNGFYPRDLPITEFVAALILPHSLAGLALLADRPLRRRWAIPALAIALAALVGRAAPTPRCTGEAYRLRGLSCELGDTAKLGR